MNDWKEIEVTPVDDRVPVLGILVGLSIGAAVAWYWAGWMGAVGGVVLSLLQLACFYWFYRRSVVPAINNLGDSVVAGFRELEAPFMAITRGAKSQIDELRRDVKTIEADLDELTKAVAKLLEDFESKSRQNEKQ